MRYLPSKSISDEFWGSLRPRIISLLSDTPCLRSWSENSLHIPSQLHWVGSDYRDQHGEPLFADLEQEAYLSKNYTPLDFNQHLKALGCTSVTNIILIPRIRHDLGIFLGSKMRGMDEDWHTRAASKLSTFRGDLLESLRNMNLVPLHTGSWVSMQSLDAIYFPDTEGVPIPTDLGIHLVQHAAILNPARKALFTHLGVKTPRSSGVVFRINKRYSRDGKIPFDVDQCVSHLNYLWWHLPRDSLAIHEAIGLLDQDKKMMSRETERKEHMYFLEKEEEYGPHQLFLSAPPNQPGLPVHFLSSSYLREPPSRIPDHGKSWKSWLKEYAGVQYHPQLKHPRLATLSDEFKYIIEHRPGKLVGLLKRYWSLYEPKMPRFVVEELKMCFVPVEGKSILQLHETFLPTPKLKALAERLKLEKFQFLILPEKLTDTNEIEWNFLSKFSVYGMEDVDFYIAALRGIAGQNRDGCSPEVLDSLFEIYSCIERHCSDPSSAAAVRYVRSFLLNLLMVSNHLPAPSSGKTKLYIFPLV